MKSFVLGAAVILLAGGMFAYKDRIFVGPNVYAAPAETIYRTLDAMPVSYSPQHPMGNLDIIKHGVEPKSITWSGTGAHAAVDCTATLVPVDAQRTRVDTVCGGGGPSEGAAGGMGAKMIAIAMVEQIDSTLRNRPFNKQKVQMASSASVLQNLPKMESDALQMQRDMQQQAAAHTAESARAEGDIINPRTPSFSQPSQPLDPKGTDPRPTSLVN